MRYTSLHPYAPNRFMICSVMVIPSTGISGLGRISVNGRSRVPLPPAMITSGTPRFSFFTGFLSVPLKMMSTSSRFSLTTGITVNCSPRISGSARYRPLSRTARGVRFAAWQIGSFSEPPDSRYRRISPSVTTPNSVLPSQTRANPAEFASITFMVSSRLQDLSTI